MRALRDFNIPKIVTDDIPVFMGLIGDLFPLVDVPRKRSTEFEKVIKAAAAELLLEAENTFVLKVSHINHNQVKIDWFIHATMSTFVFERHAKFLARSFN